MAEKKYVFAIWGPPSAGKSTLAVNMATFLAESNQLVCLISAAEFGELQNFFGVAIEANKGLRAAINSGRHPREALKEVRPNLFLLEMSTGADSYQQGNISFETAQKVLLELRDQFSFVIIDCTSYKESVFTGASLSVADKVATVMPHRASAANWYHANIPMFQAIAKKTIFVESNNRLAGCRFDIIMNAIEQDECDFLLDYVENAYSYENGSTPIVTQSGRAERKYKKTVVDLTRFLMNLDEVKDNSPKAGKKSFFKGKAKDEHGSKLFQDDALKKGKGMSKRQQRKAEQKAIQEQEDFDE